MEPRQLRSANWRRLGPASYVWAGLPDSPIHKLEAAARRLPRGAAFSGHTAAWLHGMDVRPCDPIEATVPVDAGVSARSGIALRRIWLNSDEIVLVRGVPATSIVRTVADMCCRLGVVEGVVIADAALHARMVRLDELAAWAEANRGRHGRRRVTRVIQHAEPAAESAMESRLRMLLVLGGLPRPEAQVPIHDISGNFVGRPDLYYASARLGIEYDGTLHRERLADDDQRQNNLLRAGVHLLRFTARDVLGNPGAVVSQVRDVLDETTSAGKSSFPTRRRATSAGKSTYRVQR